MSKFKYDIRSGVKKIKTKTSLTISALTLGLAGLGIAVAVPVLSHADPVPVVYNNIPSTLPGNLVSEAFEATSTSEFGGQISLAGTARTNPTVTAVMSSWGCEGGHWYTNDCSSTLGHTFSEPITLNVYNVGGGNSVGSLVTSVTQSFNIPFRPSADNTNCTGDNSGKWFNVADSTCYNGFATPISFSLIGALPDTVIVTLAYNTTDYGYQPIGPSTCSATPAGCGYDSLNVGLVNSTPAVGSNPVPNTDYLNSTWTGAYCDNGVNGIGTLRFDTGSAGQDPACPYQPALSVSASPGGVRVQIFKYVDGVQATAANANSATFPMLTSWTSLNLGNPSNVPFTLSPSPWGGIGIPYEADFVGSAAGANYTASEVTTGNNVVGATCAAGNPFALQGYTMGDTLAQAQTANKTLTPPQFTNLQSDHVMIVWNVKCPPAPVHPTNKDQCKNDGWKTLADVNNRAFKNQGDCVSYVATQGKNKANG